MSEIDYVTLDDLLMYAEVLGEPAVRDMGLLDSAVHRSQATVFSQDAYPDLPTKAAALLCSIARNHAPIGGNTPLAWMAAKAFLIANDLTPVPPSVDAAYDLVIAAATGEWEAAEVSERLAAWCGVRDGGARPTGSLAAIVGRGQIGEGVTLFARLRGGVPERGRLPGR